MLKMGEWTGTELTTHAVILIRANPDGEHIYRHPDAGAVIGALLDGNDARGASRITRIRRLTGNVRLHDNPDADSMAIAGLEPRPGHAVDAGVDGQQEGCAIAHQHRRDYNVQRARRVKHTKERQQWPRQMEGVTFAPQRANRRHPERYPRQWGYERRSHRSTPGSSSTPTSRSRATSPATRISSSRPTPSSAASGRRRGPTTSRPSTRPASRPVSSATPSRATSSSSGTRTSRGSSPFPGPPSNGPSSSMGWRWR